MRDFIPLEFRKFIPLIALGMAAFYSMSAAMVMRAPVAAITDSKCDDPKAARPVTPRGKPTEAGLRAAEPVHKCLISCLNDFDDIIDTIRDQRSYDRAKPKLLRRAREHVAQAAKYPKGDVELGQLAKHELFEAMQRHEKSLTRANDAVPEFNKFFHDEVGAILGLR